MPVTVLYDRDCGFCLWALGWLRRWDRRGALRYEAIQSASGDERLAAIPSRRRLESAHAVTDDGRVRSGGDAVAVIAPELPGGAPIAALARRFPGTVRAGYRVVASRRVFFGRALRRVGRNPIP